MTEASNLPEAAAALQWRKAMKMSRAELARRTGYAPSQIVAFETGQKRSGTPIAQSAWLRYRLACAGLATAPGFAWDAHPQYVRPGRRPSPQRPPEQARPDA